MKVPLSLARPLDSKLWSKWRMNFPIFAICNPPSNKAVMLSLCEVKFGVLEKPNFTSTMLIGTWELASALILIEKSMFRPLKIPRGFSIDPGESLLSARWGCNPQLQSCERLACRGADSSVDLASFKPRPQLNWAHLGLYEEGDFQKVP